MSLRARFALSALALLTASAVFLTVLVTLGVAYVTAEPLTARVCRTLPGHQRPTCRVVQPFGRVVVPDQPSLGTVLQLARRANGVALGGLLITLAIGTALTYWLAGLALRPVQALNEGVQRIDVDSLDTRLPVSTKQDELRSLSLAFNAMVDRLARGVERERRFVSDAAHELRTPLAVMRTTLEVALSNTEASLVEYREAAETSLRSIDRLERLTEGLLLIAAMDKVPLDDEVDVCRMVREILAELEPVARKHGIRMEVALARCPTVRGNEMLLRRAVGNVIENSLHYNREHGTMHVAVATDATGARVEVRDTGRGIPPEHIPFLFQRFWRGDPSRSRRHGGSGLGLSFTKDVIERHAGNICVQSTLGEGTTVTIRIPAGAQKNLMPA